MTKLAFFLSALAGSAIAAPSVPFIHALENLKHVDSCTFSGSSGAAQAMKAQASCSTITLNSMTVPAGKTLDLSSLKDGTRVVFKGTITWGYKEWVGPLLRISGDKITIDGAGATLDGDGARWWDGMGGNGGKTKPKFFAAHGLTDSTINDVYIKNTPVQAVSISGVQGLTVSNITINTADGDSKGGHNTDGFDIGNSSDVTINGAKVYNQDDCVAVNSGNNITFTGGLCSGGHGLSIGSVGGRSINVVDTVNFLDSVVTKSTQGIRIKTVKGATGKVKGVTYSDITMSKISNFGILIEQNYDRGDLRGDPTSGVPITGLTIKDISGKGAVDSNATNIAIVCGSSGCSNWTWSNVTVNGGQNHGSCKNVPSGVTVKA